MESYHVLWSDVDHIVPVDPADCEKCQGIAPDPCFEHYSLGAEFQS